jgi:hypothetical protein
MIKLSRLFVVTVLLVSMAAITAASALASLPSPEKKKAVAHVMKIRGAHVGLPPFVGGPYGDPSDFPGVSGATVLGESSSSQSDAQSGDDCLHQILEPLTAC